MEDKLFHFRPALLALVHLFKATIMDFEKYVLVDAMYQFFREILPLSVADSDVFIKSPEVFAAVQSEISTDTFQDYYEEIDLMSSITTKHIRFAVKIPTKRTLWDRDELLALKQDQQEGLCGVRFQESDLIPQFTLNCLLSLIASTKYKYIEYDKLTFWDGPASTTIRDHARWTLDGLEDARTLVTTRPLFHTLCFLPGNKLTYNFFGLSITKDKNCVHVLGQEKADKLFFVVFDPFSAKSVPIAKANFMDEASFVALKLPSPATEIEDQRPIDQVNVVLFDNSGSMRDEFLPGMSKQEMAKVLFGTLCDKVAAFKYSQAIGVITFGVKANILVPIGRNFIAFEKILGANLAEDPETHLFEAIQLAAKNLSEYSTNLLLAKKRYFRIICLTDGEDTTSFNIFPLVQLLQEKNIIVDFVAIGGKHHLLPRAIAAASGGLSFKIDDKDLLVGLFESEAFLSLADRQKPAQFPQMKNAVELTAFVEKKYLFVTSISRAQPSSLPNKAVAAQSVKTQPTVSNDKVSRTKRIYQEFARSSANDILPQFQLFMNEDDFNFWKVLLKGETGTLYAGGHWLLYIHFVPNYPIEPPEVRFVTPIYHCNINQDGKICHEIITTKWAPSTRIVNVLANIIDLLKEPNYGDALDLTKGALLRDDKPEYEKQVKAYVVKHASNLAEIKQKFSLVDS